MSASQPASPPMLQMDASSSASQSAMGPWVVGWVAVHAPPYRVALVGVGRDGQVRVVALPCHVTLERHGGLQLKTPSSRHSRQASTSQANKPLMAG